LVVGQSRDDVKLVGKGTVENVVGSGQPEPQPVGSKRSVQVVLVVLEVELGVVVDVAVGTVMVVLVGEPELLKDEEERGEDGMVVLVGAAEVFVGKEVDELVRMDLEESVEDAELAVMLAVSFEDREAVVVGIADAELLAEEDREDVVELDVITDDAAGGIDDAEMPVPFWVLAGAASELELVKIGEQHEDEKGVPPLDVMVTTILVEAVIRVGAAVLPVPRKEELDVNAKLLDDEGIEPVPGRPVVLTPTETEPVPKADDLGTPVTTEELLRCKEKLCGGWAENEEIEKPTKLDEVVPVVPLPDIVLSNEVVVEELVPSDVVATGLPTVEFAAPGSEVVLRAAAVGVAVPGPDVLLLAEADPIVVGEVAAVEEATVEGGSAAEPWDVALLGADVLTGSPVVLLAAEVEGDIIEIIPLDDGWDVLNADIAVVEEAMELGLNHE
jgi:hypothetical protein